MMIDDSWALLSWRMPWRLLGKNLSVITWASKLRPFASRISPLKIKIDWFSKARNRSSLLVRGWRGKGCFGGLIEFFLNVLFEHIFYFCGSCGLFFSRLETFSMHLLTWFLESLCFTEGVFEVAWVSLGVVREIGSLIRRSRRESRVLKLIFFLNLRLFLVQRTRLWVLDSLSNIGSKVLPNIKVAFTLDKRSFPRHVLSLSLSLMLSSEGLGDRA